MIVADSNALTKGVVMNSNLNPPQEPMRWFADELGRHQRTFEEANRLGLRPEPEQVLSFTLHLTNSSAVPGTVIRNRVQHSLTSWQRPDPGGMLGV